MAEGDVQGGYRVHGDESAEGEPLFRVPDLLTEQEFIDYMNDVYGVTVTIT